MVDDDLARRWCRRFLNALDPSKLYFEKADIDEFTAQATTLDDAIREGNVDLAVWVWAHFLSRGRRAASEAISHAPRQVRRLHDRRVDRRGRSLLLDYAGDPEAMAERWRKQIKFNRLSLKMTHVEGDEAVRRLSIRARDFNRLQHQCDINDLLGVYLTALVQSVDSLSVALNPRIRGKRPAGSLNLKLEGIGAREARDRGWLLRPRPVARHLAVSGRERR